MQFYNFFLCKKCTILILWWVRCIWIFSTLILFNLLCWKWSLLVSHTQDLLLRTASCLFFSVELLSNEAVPCMYQLTNWHTRVYFCKQMHRLKKIGEQTFQQHKSHRTYLMKVIYFKNNAYKNITNCSTEKYLQICYVIELRYSV